MKKTLKIIGNVVIWVFVVICVALSIAIISSANSETGVSSLFGYTQVTVLSNSMKGGLKEDDHTLPDEVLNDLTKKEKKGFSAGDMLFCKLLSDDEKRNGLDLGDVITFFREENGGKVLYTHRIVEIKYEGGYTIYCTKGDNNPVRDDQQDEGLSFTVQDTDVLAKYTGNRIVLVGFVANFLQKPTGFLCCIVIPLVIFFGYELFNFIFIVYKMRLAKNGGGISKESEEEIKRRAIEEYLKSQAQNNDADGGENVEANPNSAESVGESENVGESSGVNADEKEGEQV